MHVFTNFSLTKYNLCTLLITVADTIYCLKYLKNVATVYCLFYWKKVVPLVEIGDLVLLRPCPKSTLHEHPFVLR